MGSGCVVVVGCYRSVVAGRLTSVGGVGGERGVVGVVGRGRFVGVA